MFKRVQLGHHCIGPQPGSPHPYTVLGLHPSMTPALVPLRDMFKRAQLLDLTVHPPSPILDMFKHVHYEARTVFN